MFCLFDRCWSPTGNAKLGQIHELADQIFYFILMDLLFMKSLYVLVYLISSTGENPGAGGFTTGIRLTGKSGTAGRPECR